MSTVQRKLHEGPSDNPSSAVNGTADCLYPQLRQPHERSPTRYQVVYVASAIRVLQPIGQVRQPMHPGQLATTNQTYSLTTLARQPPLLGRLLATVCPFAIHNRVVMQSELTAVATDRVSPNACTGGLPLVLVARQSPKCDNKL
jgi:hypothetical protein